MLPYIPHPTLELGGYELTAFRVLTLTAVIVQYQVVVRAAPRFALSSERAGSLCIWAIGIGLVSAHVFDVLFYFPEQLRENPLVLLAVWGSLSSTGGMVGGLLGLLLVMRWQGTGPRDALRLFDLCVFALPFTLATGRLGCALQHDHLGVASTHPLAVAFPDGPRFDLGLLEFLFVGVIALVFVALARRPRPTGFFFGLFFLLYAPGRFALDGLRTGDARYFGWTPAQGLMVLAGAVGATVLVLALRRGAATDPDA